MDWTPVVEKRYSADGNIIEYRAEQNDNNVMMVGRESTIVFLLDNSGGIVGRVGRSWQEIRRRLRRLVEKVDDDWTPQGVALSIKKILAHEDTEDCPDQHRRKIEDAFRDGWEEGELWGQRYPGKPYGSDDFDPDWDRSQTKRKLDEEG